MYANTNSSSSKASNNIPEWKKKLIMRKRGGSSVNNDEHCPCNPNTQSEGDFSSKICRSNHSGFDFQELSSLKTVTIGNFNVELRSVKSDTPSDSGKFNCLSGFEAENEEDLEYGPGIVDRLRERFLNMGTKKQQHKQVRRYSSLENLPCSYVRPFKLNSRNIRQNGFKVGSGNHYTSGNVKKAQSMETLIYSSQDPPIFSTSRCAVKARILAQNLNPDETEEPLEEVTVPKNFIRAPSINEDELPKPDTVKHVKKLFEQCTTANSDIKRSDSEERQIAKLCVKKSPILDSLSETENVASDIDTVEPSVPNGFDESNGTELHQDIISPQGVLPKNPWESTSVVFDFRGKDVKPSISLNPAPFGCRSVPKKRSGSPPRNEVSDDEEDWDEMDIGADLPTHSGIVFDGENIKVGRGAILEKRNKKLSIQFDDQATSTFEYPSENASPSPLDENTNSADSEFNSLLALGSLSNSRFAPSNIDFELGVSQPLHRLPTNAKPKEDEKLDEPLDAIVPAKPEDASGWSSTTTTDILF